MTRKCAFGVLSEVNKAIIQREFSPQRTRSIPKVVWSLSFRLPTVAENLMTIAFIRMLRLKRFLLVVDPLELLAQVFGIQSYKRRRLARAVKKRLPGIIRRVMCDPGNQNKVCLTYPPGGDKL